MNNDELLYNPNFIYKDSLNYFRELIILEDPVPSNLLAKNDDSSFLKNRISRVKIEQPRSFEKSIFTSHLLHTKYAEAKEKEIINQNWVPGIIVVCFLLFAIAQYGYFKRMLHIFRAFFANRLFNQLSRDGGSLLSERVSVFLFSSFLLGLSLFIFKIYDFYYSTPGTVFHSLLLYGKILAGVFLFYFLKMGLFNICGFIFRSPKETSDYILNIYIFGQIAGVALLPIIVLSAFLNSQTVIYIGLIIIFMLYIYRLFRGITITRSNAKISVYYLILYLCTLEILPLFLLGKVLSGITSYT